MGKQKQTIKFTLILGFVSAVVCGYFIQTGNSFGIFFAGLISSIVFWFLKEELERK